jgi:hypothetical protein
VRSPMSRERVDLAQFGPAAGERIGAGSFHLVVNHGIVVIAPDVRV